MAGRDQDSERDEARERALHAKLDRTVQKYRSSGGTLRRQMRAVRKDGWTAKRRAIFLEALAETCNVQESARLVGMSIGGAYDLRKRDAGFAALWEEAKERAYEQLELRIMELMGTTVDQVETIRNGEGPDAVVKSVKVIRRVPLLYAIRLLAAHKVSIERYRMQRAALELDAAEVRDRTEARLMSVREHLMEGAARRQAEASDGYAGGGVGASPAQGGG